MNDILTSPEVGAALTQLLIAVLTGVIAVIGIAVRRFVAANVSIQQQQLLDMIAHQAVLFAEGIGATATGAQKLDAAMVAVQEQLDRAGVKIPTSQVRAAVESAVFAQFNRYKGELAQAVAEPAS